MVSFRQLTLATYVAAATKKIRIGTGVSVLNFHDPVFMAEETAMLDLLSNGRFDFGIGRGQVVYEYANFKWIMKLGLRGLTKLSILYWAMEYAGFTYQANIIR
ncbi:MAG: hypothetical protein CM1200mP27_07640 [Chloroflexota bacterium]|nr:MAG: hypothetical protein CM1200mP27_07640 [Chloroflexota bacterium]